MGEVALVIQVGDGFGDCSPLQFLRVVQFVTAGDAAGVEVADVLNVIGDGADDVAFHDLHVIDVVEQFHPWRVYALHHIDAPGGVVALIVVVVDLAVQQFHADVDAGIFGHFLDTVQADDAVFFADVVGEALAIAGEGDDVGNFGGGGALDVGAHLFHEPVMIFFAIPGVGDGSRSGRHGGGKAILADGFPLGVVDEIYAAQAEVGAIVSQFVEAHAFVAPQTDRLL